MPRRRNMSHLLYHIIDKKGNILLSSPRVLSTIGASGYALIPEADHCSLYSVSDHRARALPTHVGGRSLVYSFDWTYPIEHTLIGHVLEKKTQGRQANFLSPEDTPAGMRATASVALDTHMDFLFEPLPLYIYPYKGEWTPARNHRHSLYLLDRRGITLRSFPKDWRLHHRRYNEEGNLAELIVYKCAEYDAYNLPLYHYDIREDTLRGPYREIGELREGLRLITDMQHNTYFVDADWHLVFSCARLQKKSPFYILSSCYHGCIAFFSGMKAGLLNKGGEVVLPPSYTDLHPIGDALWWYKKKGLYGIMHEDGRVLTPPQFMIMSSESYRHGLIAACDPHDKAGYIDREGNWIIKPAFDACYTFDHPHYTIARTLLPREKGAGGPA